MNKNDAVAIIRSLLSSKGSPCSISNLNKDFRNETGVDIPLFGYSSISDFLHSIPQTVKLTGIYPIQRVSLVVNEKSAHIVSLVKRQKCGKQRRKVFSGRNTSRKMRINARCAEGQEFQKNMSKGNHGEVKKRDKGQCLMPFTLACARDGFCTHEEVSPIDLKLHASVGDYIEVRPCEILSPDRFFFHLRKFKRKFECFMNDLQLFYSTHEGIPKINASLIRPKQICAAFHSVRSEAKWYRAEIHKVVDGSQVVVNFIDFGGSAEILKDNLKFLHGSFVSLPRQACVGALANIRPLKLTTGWTPRAVKRFHDLAFKKDLVAGVVYLDPEAFRIGVALSFTKGKEIHINDTLVNEGHAEFEKGILDDQSVDGLIKENRSLETKFYAGGRKLSAERANFNENRSENASIAVRSESRESSGINVPVFYAPNIYNTNFRLKKMFSIVQEA